MMNRRSSSAKPQLFEVGYLAVAQGMTLLFPLLSTPYLIRVLGVENFGQVLIATAVSLYLGLVVDFGFNVSAVPAVVRHADDPLELRRVIGSVLAAKTVFYCAANILSVGIAALPVIDVEAGMIVLGSILLAGNLLYPSWLLQGVGMMRTMATVVAAPRVLALAALPVVVDGSHDLYQAVAILVAPTLISALLSWAVLLRRRRFRPLRPDWERLRVGTVEAFPAFVSSVSSGILGVFNTIALGASSTPREVGVYGGANRIQIGARAALVPLQTVMLPKVIEAAQSGLREAIDAVERRSRLVITIPHIIAGLVMVVAADPIVKYYLDLSVSEASPVVRILGVAICLAGLELHQYTLCVAHGMLSAGARVFAGAAALHLIYLFPLCSEFGAAGASIATALSELVLVVALTLALRSRHRAPARHRGPRRLRNIT